MLFSIKLISLLILIYTSCFYIFFDKPLNAILCLFSMFIVICIYLFMIELEFIGIIYLMIHIGAVIILFLFVTMCFNSSSFTPYLQRRFQYSLGVDIIFILSINNCFDISGVTIPTYTNSYLNYFHFLQFQMQDIQVFGFLLYTQFFLYLLIMGVILLLVMLGVIIITLDSTMYKQQTDYRDRNLASVLLIR